MNKHIHIIFVIVLLCLVYPVFKVFSKEGPKPRPFRPGLGNSSGQPAASRASTTFVINTCITDLKEFSDLVKAASRLKAFGQVQVNVSTLADKSFYEIPPGGNPWNEYACNNPTLAKFFPDAKIAPFIPADYVEKNRKILLEKTRILRENGMGAAFFANEPAFLPAAFFTTYPLLRGPRVDHPRRSRVACFSPCLSTPEMQEIYAGMMADLLRNAPEIHTFYFKTNDAGSGNCWSDWLYSGPNGPDHCKGETTGTRIAELLGAMQSGAARSGCPLDVYLSYPQGSSNFSDSERVDIQKKLPPHCFFNNTPDHPMVSIGSEMGSDYPVRGIGDMVSYLEDLKRINPSVSQTLFIGFGSYYNRGYESSALVDIMLGMLADRFEAGKGKDISVQQELSKYCSSWVGEPWTGTLVRAFQQLNHAIAFRHEHFNLAGIYWDVSSRIINRPLVAVPQRLSKDEESYFLPYVFNVSEEEARTDYLDIHGGRWTLPVESLRSYVTKIGQVCSCLDSIDPSAFKNDFVSNLGLALQVHASLIRSCANFTVAQEIRDRNASKLNGPVHRPDKESTWTGDTDLLKFNAVMRDELDNTAELTTLLQQRGTTVLCLAKDNAHEDTFLLGPELVSQLKRKYKVMIDHWRDIEDYLTTPFK